MKVLSRIPKDGFPAARRRYAPRRIPLPDQDRAAVADAGPRLQTHRVALPAGERAVEVVAVPPAEARPAWLANPAGALRRASSRRRRPGWSSERVRSTSRRSRKRLDPDLPGPRGPFAAVCLAARNRVGRALQSKALSGAPVTFRICQPLRRREIHWWCRPGPFAERVPAMQAIASARLPARLAGLRPP